MSQTGPGAAGSSQPHDPIDRTQVNRSQGGGDRTPPPPHLPTIPGISLHAEIARGGMGVVYSGRQDFLDRRVAVKFLSVDLGGEAIALRFQREAKILAGIKHPNIVACHAAGTTDQGQSYLVMEFIDGPSLGAWIRAQGPVPCAAALRLTQSVAQALAHALSVDVIHRDVKAENILLETMTSTAIDVDFPFVPKLVDLGLARIASAAIGEGLTSPGSVMGTPATMSPEQFDDPDSVDFRTDIYGLGCVLYEMLTGERAFHDSKLTDLIARKRQPDGPNPCSRNPSLPAAVGALVSRMLAADRDARPRSYHELVERLQTLLAKLPARLRSPSPKPGARGSDAAVPSTRPRAKKARAGGTTPAGGTSRPFAIVAAATVLVAGGGIAAWLAYRAGGDKESPPARPEPAATAPVTPEPAPAPANAPPRNVVVQGPEIAQRNTPLPFVATADDPNGDELRYRWSSPQGPMVSFFPVDDARTEVRLFEGLPGDRFRIEVAVSDGVHEPVRAHLEVVLAEYDPEDMLAGFTSLRAPWQIDNTAVWTQNTETLHVSCFARESTQSSTRVLTGQTWRIRGFLESTPAGIDPPYADTGVRLEFGDRGFALLVKRDASDNKKWSMELLDASKDAGLWTYTPVPHQRVDWRWATAFEEDWGWFSIVRRRSQIEVKFGSIEQDRVREHTQAIESAAGDAKLTLFATNGRGVFRQVQRW